MPFRASIALVGALAWSFLAPAFAQEGTPAGVTSERIQIITYVDIQPAAAAHAQDMLRAYRDAASREPGLVRLAVLSEEGRPDRFAIQETWSDFAAYDRHGKGQSAATFADAIRADLVAPLDIRLHQPFGTPGATDRESSSLVIMTHLQVSPPRLPELAAQLVTLVEHSRREDGVLQFEVFQQVTPRRNNLTLFEEWRSPEAAARHATASVTRTFRSKLGPLLGALFDQRRYQPLR